MMVKIALAVLVIYLYFVTTNGTPLLLSKMKNANIKYRWCGQFGTVMQLICRTFPDPHIDAKRTDPDIIDALTTLEDFYPKISSIDHLSDLDGEEWDDASMSSKNKRRNEPETAGIVEECCMKACSLNYMRQNYCID